MPNDKHELRKITDARTLRALAHPVRIALFEELSLGGAMTATEIGEQIGESPTTCSFHLRQLAKYGFVEEAGGGTGRSRPLVHGQARGGVPPDDPQHACQLRRQLMQYQPPGAAVATAVRSAAGSGHADDRPQPG